MVDFRPRCCTCKQPHDRDSTVGGGQHSGRACDLQCARRLVSKQVSSTETRVCRDDDWLKRSAMTRNLHEAFLLDFCFCRHAHPCNLSSKSWQHNHFEFWNVPSSPIGPCRIFYPCGACRTESLPSPHTLNAKNSPPTLPRQLTLRADALTLQLFVCSTARSGAIGSVLTATLRRLIAGPPTARTVHRRHPSQRMRSGRVNVERIASRSKTYCAQRNNVAPVATEPKSCLFRDTCPPAKP